MLSVQVRNFHLKTLKSNISSKTVITIPFHFFAQILTLQKVKLFTLFYIQSKIIFYHASYYYNMNNENNASTWLISCTYLN